MRGEEGIVRQDAVGQYLLQYLLVCFRAYCCGVRQRITLDSIGSDYSAKLTNNCIVMLAVEINYFTYQ